MDEPNHDETLTSSKKYPRDKERKQSKYSRHRHEEKRRRRRKHKSRRSDDERVERSKDRKRRRNEDYSSSSRKKQRRRKKRNYSSSSSSESSSTTSGSDGSTTSSEYHIRKRRRKKKKEKDNERNDGDYEHRKTHGKRSESISKSEQSIDKSYANKFNNEKITSKPESNNQDNTSTSKEAKRATAMAPMSREQYEAQQSIVREVFDPETGRYRLVRGTGEIVERIVTREIHGEINRVATRGDGMSFERHVKKAASSR